VVRVARPLQGARGRGASDAARLCGNLCRGADPAGEPLTYIDEVADAIRAYVPPELIPYGNVDELFRIYAVLALAKASAWCSGTSTMRGRHG
jgi:hypothetical protein